VMERDKRDKHFSMTVHELEKVPCFKKRAAL
jgi:hypothetical protein